MMISCTLPNPPFILSTLYPRFFLTCLPFNHRTALQIHPQLFLDALKSLC